MTYPTTREHANECCLKLTMHTKQNATTYTPFDYLCKLEDGAYSHIHILTKEALNDLESYKRRKKDKKEAEKILVQMDNANIVSFKDALRFHMSRLKIEPEDMPDELYLKETTFLSYYKANRNPSLKRAMIICNKLNLPYKLCIDLLKRARITLNTDKKEDELYDYLLTITNTTLDDWELFLETNGFNPLLISLVKVKIKINKAWIHLCIHTLFRILPYNFICPCIITVIICLYFVVI